MSALYLPERFVVDRELEPGPPPVEVLRYWRAKGLKIGFDHRDVWREEHDYAFSAAKIMREDVLEAMRDELDQAFAEGKPFAAFAESVEPRMKALGWWDVHEVQDPETGDVVEVNPPRRLATIFETNMRTARAVGQYDRVQRNKDTRPFLLYQVGPSVRHREQHLAWHGLLLPVDDPFWAYAWPPNGWNCYLPDTRITGHVVGGSKAWYSGQAIEIKTKSGATLSVTPNHPVLTARGWLAAGALEVGDYCVSHGAEVELVSNARLPLPPAGAVRDQQGPARVEDVFEALAAHGRRTTQVAPLDFHGDASRFVGEVNVVGSYIALVHEREAALSQSASEALLARTYRDLALKDGSRLLDAFAQLGRASGRSGKRWLAQSPQLGGRHALEAFVRSVGVAAHLETTALQKPAERDARDGAFLGELLHRSASDVALDQILSVCRYPYSGHVYDLETKSGWLLANGLAASNCKCHVRTVSELEHVRLVRNGVNEGEPEPVLDDDGLPTGHVKQKRIAVRTRAPEVPLVPWENKRTGQVELVRAGIDPGFDKRPGEGRRDALKRPRR